MKHLIKVLFVLIVEPADVQGQNKDLLVKVIKDGKETSVYQKLITRKKMCMLILN